MSRRLDSKKAAEAALRRCAPQLDANQVPNSDSETDNEQSNQGDWQTVARSSSKNGQSLCKGKTERGGCTIMDKDTVIVCKLCETEFHPACQDLSAEAHKAISKHKLLWLCLYCKNKLISMNEMEKRMEKRIEETEKTILKAIMEVKPIEDIKKNLEAKIANMETAVIEKIKEQQVMVESSLREQQQVVKEMPKFTAELKTSAKELKELVVSKDDKDNREKSMLLHNIPESIESDAKERKDYDEASFQNIVSALVGNATGIEVEKVYRLGKKREGPDAIPRLMMVELKKKDDVDQLIKKRTGLRDLGFPNIYLTRNLSPDERAKEKALREELHKKGKDTHYLFRGKVIPRKLTQ